MEPSCLVGARRHDVYPGFTSWGILGQFSSSKMGFHGPWDGRLTRSPNIFPDAAIMEIRCGNISPEVSC
jgi:hypothetical protein